MSKKVKVTEYIKPGGDSTPKCFCGALMIPAGIGKYPYSCIAKDKHPEYMVYQGCSNGHTGWTCAPVQPTDR